MISLEEALEVSEAMIHLETSSRNLRSSLDKEALAANRGDLAVLSNKLRDKTLS
jgi:hypothetical protein